MTSSQPTPSPRPRPRERLGLLAIVLRFMAGVFLVGLPLAAIFGVHWTIALLVLVTCGVLAVRRGDSFFHRVADSNWWQVVRGFFLLRGE